MTQMYIKSFFCLHFLQQRKLFYVFEFRREVSSEKQSVCVEGGRDVNLKLKKIWKQKCKVLIQRSFMLARQTLHTLIAFFEAKKQLASVELAFLF